MKTGKIVWGLVLVFIGVILMLDNFGVIDFSWSSVWRLWPLLLIIWGVELIFSTREYPAGRWISGALTTGILIYVGYYGSTHGSDDDRWMRNFNLQGGKGYRSVELRTAKYSEPYDDSLKRVKLNISGGATSYNLSHTTRNLFDADIRYRRGKYSLTRTTRDNIEVLSLRMPDSTSVHGPRGFSLNNVEMQLSDVPIWDIRLEMGAGKADLDLSAFKVANLDIKGGAASFELKLGELQSLSNVTVQTGVAKVKISVPETVGCLIKVKSALSTKDFDGFIKQSDNSYTTHDYNSSARKILINLDGGVSDFEVRRY
jgi:hypothetical protein